MHVGTDCNCHSKNMLDEDLNYLPNLLNMLPVNRVCPRPELHFFALFIVHQPGNGMKKMNTLLNYLFMLSPHPSTRL